MKKAAIAPLSLGLLLGLVVLRAAVPAAQESAPIPADVVLVDARVYTVDAARSWAEAVAIRGTRVAGVGTRASLAPLIGPSTRVVPLGGRMVLPGFHDSHVHPLSGGVELAQCNLNGLGTRDEVFDAIRRYANAHADRAWIVGGGFDLPMFAGGSPDKKDLDRLVPDRPVFLSSADGHSAWVNSKALAIGGVTSETPDPTGGRIERNADGSPSGTLRETAMDLVSRHLPPVTEADRADGLQRGLDLARRLGITSLVEASADGPYVETYRRASDSGRLTARVLVSQRVDPDQDDSQLDAIVARSRSIRGPRLRTDAAKFFADGVIEGATAALLEPYLDRPGFRGDLNFEPERMARLVTRLFGERIQVHVHAIGDRAIRTTLDAIAVARRETGWHDARPHLAHIQLFDPADIPRFRELGALANFQPLWAYADAYIRDLTVPRLGPERSRWLYPLRSLSASGAVVVGGSDWSVSSMNPLEAMQVALTRQGIDEADSPPWIPEERVTLAEMIAAYTINGAYLQRMERETGSIEPGKLADLVVVDRNLFAVPAAEIHRARVQATILDGAVVWSDGTLFPPK